MSDRNPVHELNPEAAALIRVNLTGDIFTMDRVLTRTHEAGVDYWYLAFAVASQAAGMLAQACGSKAQAVDLVDCWLNSAIRARARVKQLQLDLCLGMCLTGQAGVGLS
jgi:hypothetical protein